MALSAVFSPLFAQQASNPVPIEVPDAPGNYSIKTSVRRVVVDVVVTDAEGRPKRGLTQKDFSVEEDGKPQGVLSFDPHERDAWTGTLPTGLPPDTFINLPREPEEGPLNLLLYDMVNIGDTGPVDADTGAEIFARKEIVKFIESKPPGARFALMVNSDGLHLIQGFTSDRRQLLAVLDPRVKVPHMPRVFLYSNMYRPDDPYYYLAVMKDIEQYLQGLPGRKNVIWVSRRFPFAVFSEDNAPELVGQVRRQLALMAGSQISIYPVEAGSIHRVNESSLVQDEVAAETGGHAFYNTNGLTDALNRATADGETYYTLSYSSTNPNYDGKLRRIRVQLAAQGYRLAYRHQYFADPGGPEKQQPARPSKAAVDDPIPDNLYAYIRHGAPMSHDLLFQAHVKPIGTPQLPTSEPSANLSEEPAHFQERRKNRSPPRPVPLQSYVIEYAVPSRQFSASGSGEERNAIEFAVAAYNADGVLLNGNIAHVRLVPDERLKYYPTDQHFEAPANAAWMSLVVRDPATGRIGSIEFPLPLPPERLAPSE